MNYLPVEKSLQEVFVHNMPLSPAQTGRIAKLCSAIVLAGEVNLTKIARFVKGDNQQASRVRWIKRLLEADFLSQERVYQPLLKQALQGFHESCWHVVIDRTALWEGVDLATISLNYRKRAIPLVWTCVPYGGASEATYIQLLRLSLGTPPITAPCPSPSPDRFPGRGGSETSGEDSFNKKRINKKELSS